MLTLSAVREKIFRLKKYQEPLEKWVFPIILLLYPLIGVAQGVDTTDTTYSLGNYEYTGNLDPMWIIATYIPNMVGRLFMALPGGKTMLGMNIYCSFVISATAIVAYYLLQRWMPGWMMFIGEIIAINLCWCPRVILYNYLTYFCFTTGTLLLMHAMTDYQVTKWKFVLAGFFFGISVMVRFPNIVEAAMILILWYYEGIHKNSFKEIMRKTGLCIAGYLIGFIIPFIAISITYGFGAYPEMISSLFSMSAEATDYSAGGMAGAILAAWYTSFKHMVIMIPCMIVGSIMFFMKPGRFYWIKRILYIAGIFMLLYYYYQESVFTRSYFYYDSMFEPAMMFLICGICFFSLGVTRGLRGQASERSLCLACLLIMIITPLGSNNYTYPLLNNLFIVAPFIMWMFRRVRQAAGAKELHFTWKAMYMAILVLIFFQSTIFHYKYSFVDGTDGTERSALIGTQELSKAAGMYTTPENADSLAELSSLLSKEGLRDKKLLQFGNAPGLSYLLDMEPAIFSTWPNLDSNTIQKFEDAISGFETGDSTELPVVIVNPNFEGEVTADKKYTMLLDFLETLKYNKIFESDRFEVYAAR
ncbi:hypothetical protein SAMN04487770_103118 [Butyrivibrio sp. ob235]|uniref:hypothetical protein n=1 Tax=Butyrivibrio sp. ob235 TaxID=1761780 RepID=UPI0008CBC5BC|nr:hypothetical protein [Butyrivibrio sp. ob235]SEK83373.1 hypothetical protein SAMN04487770_103118 [Butyrivibrio sp. ob235]